MTAKQRGMVDRSLTLRQLNRATLDRQILVDRKALSVPDVIERLGGLQAQAAAAPYVGLWTRIPGFTRDDLASPIADRTVVKAAWVRGTLHLVTAADYVRHRSTLQPMLTAGFESIAKRRGPAVDVPKVVAAARRYFAQEPRTFAELSAWLTERYPDADVGPLRHAVRMHLPIVQVPVEEGWSYPNKPRFTLADDWLGTKVPVEPSSAAAGDDAVDDLVRRYLRAFGPAGVTDMQTWSGLPAPSLKAAVARLEPELVTYRAEGRTELFDLADLALPDADAPVPARFLPEYDNVLLSHRKRTRIVADEHRKQVYLPALRVAATILVDGFVAGTWKVAKAKGEATLTVEPFGRLAKADRAALAEDGEGLVRFVEPSARSYAVRV
jgi:hypothetical protein